MPPLRTGRALGIIVRLLGQRVLPAPPPPPTPEQQHQASAARVARAERLGRQARLAGRQGKHLGRSVWNPFARATGTLWHEVTGLFFALFALFFAQHAWQLRAAIHAGPQHRGFVTYFLLAALFAYFSASSFLRARRRPGRRA